MFLRVRYLDARAYTLRCKMPEIIDDKSEHCVPFILHHIKQHREHYTNRGQTPPPFFIGLNGVQGAGKTTLVGE